jgi:hypothetical protein
MTLEQIDSDLRAWDKNLRLASDNMLELSDSVSYQRLLGEGHWPKAQLTGLTAERAQPAIDGLHTLWVHYSLLRDTIARAQKLRGSVSMLLPSRNLLAEIEELLHTPSIELPAVATPLEQRGLLATAETAQAVSPERLLAAMHETFQQGRDVVLAVGAAWDRLPQQFIGFEAELARLAAADGSLSREIAAARERLAALQREFDTDPLAAAADSQALAAEIDAIGTRIEQTAAERRRVADDLHAARQLLAEVGQAHRQAAETVARCKEKVRLERAAAPRPADDQHVAALETWLAKLDAEVAAGRWQPVRVGVQRWSATARQYLAADRQARQACQVLLDQRRDLRGLLGALKAKATANGRAEDPALVEIERTANDLLAARPTPLEALQRAVADYQQRLL